MKTKSGEISGPCYQILLRRHFFKKKRLFSAINYDHKDDEGFSNRFSTVKFADLTITETKVWFFFWREGVGKGGGGGSREVVIQVLDNNSGLSSLSC